jgi:hypothetical protein
MDRGDEVAAARVSEYRRPECVAFLENLNLEVRTSLAAPEKGAKP